MIRLRGARGRVLPLLTVVACAVLAAAACVLVVDADGETGHPCDGERDRCLPGYSCVEGICREDPSTGVLLCGSCPKGEKCDHRTGRCVDVCEASVCPTGHGCEPGGECEPLDEGLGSICETDQDCAGAVPGCSTDPDDPGRVLCACFKPAHSDTGVCLGLPSRFEDCESCGDARCVQESFSYAGSVTLCVPGGFRTCAEGQAHCADHEHESWCTLFAWETDPGVYRPGEYMKPMIPLGVLPACVSSAEESPLEPGDECDSDDPLACGTGLCLPAGEGKSVCTHPCRRDIICREVAEGRCVLAPVDNYHGGARIYETTHVCGTEPTLGRSCTVGRGSRCGTDAPYCVIGLEDTGVCTRPCRDNADCSLAQGFECHPRTASCL